MKMNASGTRKNSASQTTPGSDQDGRPEPAAIDRDATRASDGASDRAVGVSRHERVCQRSAVLSRTS